MPAFEFAPEACHDQSYPEIVQLFKSFRVTGQKAKERSASPQSLVATKAYEKRAS